MDGDDVLLRTVRLAAVAEIVFLRADGRLDATALTPLVCGERPAFALPYARADLADHLAVSPTVAVVFSDSRLALKGWEPLAVTAWPLVSADEEGVRFQAEMLDQELRKHPPSRLLLDTPILRREHWWYVPRLIVRLGEVAALRPVGRRRGPEHAVVGWADGDRVVADTAEVRGWDDERPALRSLAGHPLATLEGRPGVLFRHDFAVPDLDRWTECRVRGRLERGRLIVEERDGSPTVGPPRTLLGRLRALRDLERGCRRELRARRR